MCRSPESRFQTFWPDALAYPLIYTSKTCTARATDFKQLVGRGGSLIRSCRVSAVCMPPCMRAPSTWTCITMLCVSALLVGKLCLTIALPQT
jgi:hypothetical protein